MRTSVALFALVTALLWVHLPAHGRERSAPLRARLRPWSVRLRSGAPCPVDITLDWQGRGLAEGRLLVEVYSRTRSFQDAAKDETAALGDSGRTPRPVVSLCTPPLVLPPGKTLHHLLLPPIAVEDTHADLGELALTFVQEERRLPLVQYPVKLPNSSQRWAVIGVCDEETRSTPLPWLRDLRFESLHPLTRDARLPRDAVTTSFARLAPRDLPHQPLAYCGLDMLVLAGSGFTLARERQLAAVRRWVDAGGSLVVWPTGPLGPEQLAFLNYLAADGAGAPARPYRTTSAGQLHWPEDDGPPPFLCHRCGLGRAVVLAPTGLAPERLRSPAWRQAKGFLWHLRHLHARALAELGTWDPQVQLALQQAPAVPEWARYRQRYRYDLPPETFVADASHHPIPFGHALRAHLMPERFRLIPFWLICLLLTGFVFLVGPVEWVVLGRWRWRRYTWLTFPALCIAFTAILVFLAQHFLGTQTSQRSLWIVDEGQDGRFLRASRYDLLLPAQAQVRSDTFAQALPALLPLSVFGHTPHPVDFQSPRYGMAQPGLASPWSTEPGEIADRPALALAGNCPQRTLLTQKLRQWQPRLLRTFTLAADSLPTASPLRNLPGNRHFHTAAELAAALPRTHDLAVHQFHGGDVLSYAPGGRLLEDSALALLCQRPRAGLFGAVFAFSPAGGPHFEDLSLHDQTNPQQSLLVAVKRHGKDLILFRRLSHCPDAPQPHALLRDALRDSKATCAQWAERLAHIRLDTVTNLGLYPLIPTIERAALRDQLAKRLQEKRRKKRQNCDSPFAPPEGLQPLRRRF